MRIKVVRLAIFALLLLIAMNLVNVQLIRGRYFYNLSKNNRIRVVPLEGIRGRILDRNGSVLVDNRVSLDVLVMPQELREQQELFEFLSRTLGQTSKRLMGKYRQGKSAPFAPVVVAKGIDRETAIVLEENRFRFPGLLLQQGYQRVYRFGAVNAHVLGYVGKVSPARMEKLKGYGYTSPNTAGYSGIEEYYDEILRGEEGGLQIEVDSRGQQVRLLGLRDPAKGKDIGLTIDSRIQTIAYDLLGTRPGAIVIMDMQNGEILGLVSAPGFDPNVFVKGLTPAEAAYIFSNSQSPLLNRAISGQYPPGSVFKVAVAIAGLESDKITAETSFLCPGFYTLGNRQFRCTHVHGLQNLFQAIAHSCNVYFYQTGLKVGPEVISQFARIFALGQVTQVDLPYEEAGAIPSPHPRSRGSHGWYKGDTLNFSIGQGDVLTTPLQLVRMMAVVATNGRMVQPHLIKTISGVPVALPKPLGRIDVTDESFRLVQTGLKDVVDEDTGTGHILDVPGLQVAGKTGTAQASGQRENHAWFVGYAISEKNQLAFCVFLEHGGSSRNAVEITRELLIRLKQQEQL